jgi:hypothetical protein
VLLPDADHGEFSRAQRYYARGKAPGPQSSRLWEETFREADEAERDGRNKGEGEREREKQKAKAKAKIAAKVKKRKKVCLQSASKASAMKLSGT